MTPVVRFQVKQSEAKPEDDALTYIDNPELEQLIARNELIYQSRTFLQRSYENVKCFFMVFKPYDSTYASELAWYKYKAIDAVRKNISQYSKEYMLTRETLASKVHINVLCYSSDDLVKRYNNKNRLNKFWVFAKCIASPTEREFISKYITKESKERPFHKFRDWIIRYTK